jgi:hypothetical protein
MCTAQWSLYVPHSCHYMYRTVVTICTASLTFSNSAFCPHSVFMCFVWIWEKTAIISLYSVNWLVCITGTECVYCAVRTGCLNTVLVFEVRAMAQVVGRRPVHVGFVVHKVTLWQYFSSTSVFLPQLYSTNAPYSPMYQSLCTGRFSRTRLKIFANETTAWFHKSISEFFNKKLQFAIHRPNGLCILDRHTQTAKCGIVLLKEIKQFLILMKRTEDCCNVRICGRFIWNYSLLYHETVTLCEDTRSVTLRIFCL